ncbi:inverted formin-2-like [Hyperolius riggenbachi]|uniref:inverted formin-2-like n=1 Tax=Hyperolius riggenbachi TaxID=752182 RepID=UPI0035A30DBD
MLINMNMGSKDNTNVCDSPPIQYNDFLTPKKFPAPEIPAPPPPPPPIIIVPEAPKDMPPDSDPKRRSRLRNFNWEAIPLEKVKGRCSLWSSETFQGDLQIDTRRMEELFGKQEEDLQLRSCKPRRSLSLGDAHMNKVFLLDSRRSMNIGIFLKQFKRSAAQIVEDIKLGKADIYSSERLSGLLKNLPDREEVQRLKSFQGDRGRLSEADLFILLLMDVPSYCLRLEALILKKDFQPAIVYQLSAARELKTAVEELLHCSDLHFILKLVLKAGNFMNAGGYAGNAAGFRVSSLLKLADTKANKPGMNLLHFVVMEVQKKDPNYLSFADGLKHVQSASRLSEDSLFEEFSKVQSWVNTMHHNLAAQEQQDLKLQMDEFLEYADEQLHEVQKEIEELQISKQHLVEFLCEDENTFHLEECCKIFSSFCQKFHTAIKENKVRELEEQRRQQWEKKRLQKRHSMATCGALEAQKSADELELTLERNLRNRHRFSSVRLCRMRSLGTSSPRHFVPHSEQRERIQEYCDQKNAEQMREMSERVLRQQIEYKSSKNVNTGQKSSFYPESSTMNTSCQPEDNADIETLCNPLHLVRAEISQLSPEREKSEVSESCLIHHVNDVARQKSQNINQVNDQQSHKLLHNSTYSSLCPASSVTKAETHMQTDTINEAEFPSQPLVNPKIKPARESKYLHETTTSKESCKRFTTDALVQPKPLYEEEIRSQFPPHFISEFTKESLDQCGPKASSQSPSYPDTECRQRLLLQSKCTTQPGLESANDFLGKSGLGTESRSKIPENVLNQSVSGALMSEPMHCDSQRLVLSNPECNAKTLIKSDTHTIHQQGAKPWKKQKDPFKSQIPKKLPTNHKVDNKDKDQAEDHTGLDLLDLQSQSLCTPDIHMISNHDARAEVHEQLLSSNVLSGNQVQSEMEAPLESVVQRDLDTLSHSSVFPEQHRSAPERATNQNPVKNAKVSFAPTVSISFTETLTKDASETVLHTLIMPHSENFKTDGCPSQSSSQSTIKVPQHNLPQSTIKTFKQTLMKAPLKNTTESVAPYVSSISNASIVNTKSEDFSQNQDPSMYESSRMSSSQPESCMSRIKYVENVPIGPPNKKINVQIASPQQNTGEAHKEVSRVVQAQDIDYSFSPKGIKEAQGPVHRESPNPCSKWKRELRNTAEKDNSYRLEFKAENSNMGIDKNSSEHRSGDNVKHSGVGRAGSTFPKKVKTNDLGVRRVLVPKDVPVAPMTSSATRPTVSTAKQVNTEVRDGKISIKASGGSVKPPSSKSPGSSKHKKDNTCSNTSEYGKSERKISPLITSRHSPASIESTGQNTENGKEPVWPSQIPPKKANSVARVAIHVIKHCEVSSTLTRGSKIPCLATQPIWR